MDLYEIAKDIFALIGIASTLIFGFLWLLSKSGISVN